MFVWLVALALVGIFLKMYLFEIYEVRAEFSKTNITAGDQQELVLKVIPLNAFGFKAPFRSVPATVEITSGSDLATFDDITSESGIFIFHSGWRSGTVEIKISSKYSLFPMIVTFTIEQPVA